MTKNTNIDILPMACVGLLLVVMMILSSPMIMSHTTTPVAVPQTHTAERKTEQDIVVTLTKEGALHFNDQPTDRLELENKIGDILKQDPNCLVVVRADKEVFHKDVLDLIAMFKQAGAVRIACATKKRKD